MAKQPTARELVKFIESMLTGTHRHKCPDCGTIWEHGNDCASDDGAHTCPDCGSRKRDCRKKFWGEGTPAPEYAGASCRKV